MPQIGLELPVEQIDELFDSLDPSGDGEIEYHELKKGLKAPSPTPGANAWDKVRGAKTATRKSGGSPAHD